MAGREELAMLTRFRIEVEEKTIAETIVALTKYEHALVATEAQRYWAQWPHMYEVRGPDREAAELDERSTFTKWDLETGDRDFFIEELGLEITEEVIELLEPGLYKGRRVVRLMRIDTRSDSFVSLKEAGPSSYFDISVSGLDPPPNSGTNP
jgi:hypothetical protein